MIYYLIYQTTNMLNDMKYIGKHITNKLDDDYLGSGLRLNHAIRKYGRENFSKEILHFCSDIDELNQLERMIVKESLVNDPAYYNMMLGGQGGPQTDEKVREKLKIGSRNQWKNLTKSEKREKAKPLWSSRNTEDRRNSVKGEKNPIYGLRAKDIPGWSEKLSENSARRDNNIHKFVNDDGNTFIGQVSQFYKTFGLDRSHVSRVVRGIKNSVHGWRYHGIQ